MPSQNGKSGRNGAVVLTPAFVEGRMREPWYATGLANKRPVKPRRITLSQNGTTEQVTATGIFSNPEGQFAFVRPPRGGAAIPVPKDLVDQGDWNKLTASVKAV